MNINRKRSPIWFKCSKLEMQALVAKSRTFTEVLTYFGLGNHGNNYRTLRDRLDYEKISYDHLYENIFRRKEFGRKIPLDRIMIKDSTYNRSHLKARLLNDAIFKNECSLCGISATWNGKTLVMVLDHINGINNDNRLENLRLICPNCNSQTVTFAGKNSTPVRNVNNFCSCGKRKDSQSKTCKTCYKTSDLRYKKFIPNRPSKEQLTKEISTMTMVAIGRKYGVSDNAIRKWAKNYGIII